jgi:hypothetical protein
MARKDRTKYVLDQTFLEFRLFVGKDPVVLEGRINMEEQTISGKYEPLWILSAPMPTCPGLTTCS